MRIIMAIMLFSTISWAKTIKVAVLDTGFDFKKEKHVKLCKDGHKSFTKQMIPQDFHGHGTNIAGLIAQGNENVDYCMIIVDGMGIGSNYMLGLKYISELEVDIVNISGGGELYSVVEHLLITKMRLKGTKIVVAAGNNRYDLDKECKYFPACLHPDIIVIGNTAPSSNFGKVVDEVIDGNYKTALGITLSGSSQSTAIKTSRLIREMK